MTLLSIVPATLRAVVLAVAGALGLAACGGAAEPVYPGWIEADLIFVGPDETGRVETLAVREGTSVSTGSPLFTIDADLQQADLASAEAAHTNAKIAYDRAQNLLKTSVGTQKSYDDAEAALRQAEARLNTAKTRLARRVVSSPATGTIEQVYYRPGEMVPAGRPVVAVLPPGNVKVRFYVPQADLSRVAIGSTVRVACDGCPQLVDARVDFVSRTAEFTPPVIYSLEERAKLVFLVEARPEHPETMRVGQPVSVRLQPLAVAAKAPNR